jgi:TRAP-type C4-dicarboxylate transport system permease small subunit
MNLINTIDENMEKGLLIVTLSLMTVFIIIQVVMRYVLQMSLTWSEEFIRWTFVWFIWIGISYGFKVRRHVSIPMVVDLLPQRSRLAISAFSHILMAVFFIALFYYGYKQAISPLIMRRTAITLYWPFTEMRVSSLWLYASMPLGALLSAFRLTQNAIQDIKSLRQP